MVLRFQREQINAEIEKRAQELFEIMKSKEIDNREKQIELEVQRRVYEARKHLEKEMQDEWQKQKQLDLKKQLENEVHKQIYFIIFISSSLTYFNKLLC